MKVSIIGGAGAVGATVAYSLLCSGEVSEIVLVDVMEDRAYGQALDIRQAAPFLHNCNVYSGTYDDVIGSDFVVITSGVGRKPGQTRLDLAQINVNILKSVASECVSRCPNAKYIIVANPVDVLTYVFIKISGLSRNQVIGSGTILDTIRLRTKLSEIYQISQKQIHGNVFGEHGDSSFIAWSKVTIAGVPLEEFDKEFAWRTKTKVNYTHDEIEDYVKKSGGIIISKKGNTVYGIATSVTHIIKALKGAENSILPLSTMLDGEYGLHDVCLSTLCLVGQNGIVGTVPQNLNENELEKMRNSYKSIRNVIENIEF